MTYRARPLRVPARQSHQEWLRQRRMLFSPSTTSCGESKPKKRLSKPNFALLYRVAKGEQAGQPGASNMRELVWDDELEAIAQRSTLRSNILNSNCWLVNSIVRKFISCINKSPLANRWADQCPGLNHNAGPLLDGTTVILRNMQLVGVRVLRISALSVDQLCLVTFVLPGWAKHCHCMELCLERGWSFKGWWKGCQSK